MARTSNWPIAVWPASRLVGVLGEGRDRLRADVVEVVVVEAERLRLVLQGVRAELDAELGEGGVAGVLHRLAERDLVGAAVAALVVDLRRSSPVVCGSWYVVPPGTSLSASYLPLSIAAAAVTSLNVEPGGSVGLDAPG